MHRATARQASEATDVAVADCALPPRFLGLLDLPLTNRAPELLVDSPAERSLAPGYGLFLVALVALTATLAWVRPVVAFDIISNSMVPTLAKNDRVIAIASDLFSRNPHPGDLVTFHPPSWAGADPPVVKRVVALGGDLVEIRDGVLFVNNRLSREPNARSYPMAYRFGPLQVPPGYVFVLGDNRPLSEDSTSFGPVPLSRIDAIVWLRVTAGQRWCSLAGTFPPLPEC